MADYGVDKLNIELNATAKPAKDEVELLISKLQGLKEKIEGLDGDASSLNGIVDAFDKMSKSVNAMDAGNFKKISNAISAFARAGATLSKLSNSFVVVRNNASGVKDAFNGISTDKSERELEELIYKEQQTIDASKQLKENLRAAFGQVSLPYGVERELGDMYKTLRGFIGISRTNKEFGGMSSGQIEEIKTALRGFGVDSDYIINDIDLFITLGATLQDLSQTISASEERIQSYKEQLKNLDDGFMSLDDDGVTDVLEIFGNAAESAAKPVEELASSVERLGGQNPFQSITDSLQQLQGIHLSVESLSGVTSLVNAVNKISTSGANAGATFASIASGLRELSTGMSLPDLSGMAEFVKNIGKLGGKRVTAATSNLPSLANSLHVLSNMGDLNFPSVQGLEEFAQGINLLGRAKVTKAVENIPQLTNSLRQMMATLQNAPQISQNVIDMTNAMANLAAQGSKVGTSGRSLERVFGRIGSSSKSTRSLLDRLKSSLSNISRHFDRTSKSSKGLASSIGLLYAKFWALFRLFGLLKKAMDLSSDVTEVQNVVDTTFGKYSNLVNQMAKTSIQQFGMSELTVNQIASRFQAMGSAMDISSRQIKSATDYLARNNSVYDVTGNKMADMSIELTKLTADMASFYNMEQDVVAEDLAAIFTGQTRPLRKYGLDLTQATLKEWALSQGIDANIKSMSQAEKTMLRYQYVLAHTGYIMGDFQRTSDTWANQTRILRQNFEQLGIVIGSGLIQALKPAVKAMNAFLTKVTQFAQNVVNALGKIFGWKVEITTAGITDNLGESADAMEGIADGADNASGGLGNAAKNAKKLNEQLQEWQKLNVITTQNNKSGSGSGGSGGGIGAGDLDGGDSEANIVRTEGLFHSMIDNLEELGEYLGLSLKKALLNIPWADIQKKAYDFGRGFGEFIKGFTKDSEKFYLLGDAVAQTVNTIMKVFEGFADSLGREGFRQIGVALAEFINGISHGIDWVTAFNLAEKYGYGIAAAINGFVEKIDATQIGKNLANVVNVISTFFYDLGKSIKFTEIGKKFSDGVNGFLNTINATKLGRAFNTWANGLLDAADTAISRIQWDKLGTKIGTLLSEINFTQLLAKFGKVLANAIVGVIEGLTFSIKEAPIESALAVAFAAFKFTALGSVVSKLIISAIGSSIGIEFAANSTLVGAIGKGLFTVVSNGMNSALVALATSGTAFGTGIVKAIAFGMANLGPIAAAIAAVVGVVAFAHDQLTLSARELEEVFTNTGMDVAVEKINSVKDALENLDRKSKDIQDVYSQDIFNAEEQYSHTQKLIQSYEELSNKQNLNFVEEEQLKNVSDELVHLFPELNQYLNERGVLIGVSTEQLDKYNEEIRKELQLEAKKQQYISTYNLKQEAIQKAIEAQEAYDNVLKSYDAVLRDTTGNEREHVLAVQEAQKEVDAAAESRDKANTSVERYGNSLAALDKELYNVKDGYSLSAEYQEKYNQAVASSDKDLAEMIISLAEAKGITLETADGFEKASEKINSFTGYMSGNSQEYRKYAKLIMDENGNLNGSQDEVIAKIDAMAKQYEDTYGRSNKSLEALKGDVKSYYSDLNSETGKGNQALQSHKNEYDKTKNKSKEATDAMSSNMKNYSNNANSAMTSAKNSIDKEKASTDAAKRATDEMVTAGGGMVRAGDDIARGAATGEKAEITLKKAIDDSKRSFDEFMQGSGKTFTIHNSGFDALTSKIKGAIDWFRDLFSYDGKTISVGTSVRGNAGGGIFYGNKWHNITQYAGGGLPRTAELFMARENGLPEMVGSIGGHTAVMNNDQIVASVSDGVARAVSATMAQEISELRKQNAYLREIASKNFGISSRDVFNATRKEANDYYRRTGNPAFA